MYPPGFVPQPMGMPQPHTGIPQPHTGMPQPVIPPVIPFRDDGRTRTDFDPRMQGPVIPDMTGRHDISEGSRPYRYRPEGPSTVIGYVPSDYTVDSRSPDPFVIPVPGQAGVMIPPTQYTRPPFSRTGSSGSTDTVQPWDGGPPLVVPDSRHGSPRPHTVVVPGTPAPGTTMADTHAPQVGARRSDDESGRPIHIHMPS